jgi:hypothetical protein
MKHIQLFEEYTKTPYMQIKELENKGAINVDNIYQLEHLEKVLTEKGYKENIIGEDEHTIPDEETSGIIWSVNKQWHRHNFEPSTFHDSFDEYFKLKPEFKGWETGNRYGI